MSDHPNRKLVLTGSDEEPGSSLMGMLVAGLILIVIGMLAVVFIA
jgi:hypothetical protein